MMLTQTVLALVLFGQASAAWAVPFLALQGRSSRRGELRLTLRGDCLRPADS
jgi:hypothetical protein